MLSAGRATAGQGGGEGGAGYTLSGKPLDTDSAAAKAYGFKPGMLESAPFPLLCVAALHTKVSIY